MLKITEFAKQVVKESNKISWASRKEATISMFIVLGVVIVASLFFLLVDVSAIKVVQLLLNLGVDSSDL